MALSRDAHGGSIGLPWYFYGVSMVAHSGVIPLLPWCFPSIPRLFSWWCMRLLPLSIYGASMGLLWCFYGVYAFPWWCMRFHCFHCASIWLSWCFYRTSMGLSWLPWDVHRAPMALPRPRPWVLSWISMGLSWCMRFRCLHRACMVLPWCFHGTIMVVYARSLLPWCFHGLSRCFHGFFPWRIHGMLKKDK